MPPLRGAQRPGPSGEGQSPKQTTSQTVSESYSASFACSGWPVLIDSLYRHKFLNPFTGRHLARVYVSMGVRRRDVQRVELAGQMTGMSKPAGHGPVVPIQNPYDAVHHIRDVKVLLLRVRREIYRSRGIVAAVVGHKKFLQIFPLLCKHLNSVAAPVAHVDEPVVRNVHAVNWLAKLFRGRSSGNTRRQRI